MMLAKYSTRCCVCRRQVAKGDAIDYARDTGARCELCVKTGRHPKRVNGVAAPCADCGCTVEPGKGSLIPDERISVTAWGVHREFKGWIVRHLDRAACLFRLRLAAQLNGASDAT